YLFIQNNSLDGFALKRRFTDDFTGILNISIFGDSTKKGVISMPCISYFVEFKYFKSEYL
ncbi:MAG: hypothetical protein L0G96_12405, partial [Acinetobacter sp.]|nr:hypothetical protein [Acinetobacter sp.]